MRASTALSRAAMFSALTVVFFFCLNLPILNFVGMLLLPLPLTLLGMAYGPAILGSSTLVVLVLLAMLQGLQAVIFYLPFAVCSVVLGAGLFYKVRVKRLLLIALIGVGASLYLSFHAGSHLAGIDQKANSAKMEQELRSSFEKNFLVPARESKDKLSLEYQAMVKDTTVGTKEIDAKKFELEQAIKLEENTSRLLESLMLAMRNFWPMVWFAIFFLLVLEFQILGKAAKRFKFGEVPPLEFSRWKLPGAVSWIFLTVLFASLYFQGAEMSARREFLIGIGYTMQLVYFVFGLSFMSFMMLRMKLSVPIRVVVVCLGLLFSQVLVFLGIFDSLFNFRKSYVDGDKGA